MKMSVLPMATVWVLTTASAFASPCSEQITSMEARLNEAAEASVSTSSGGQGVAAAREAQAMQAADTNKPVPAPIPPYQADNREAQATQRAAQAGGGGDKVMQAKATLNRARTLDQQGDGAACLEAVSEARRQLGTTP